MKLQWKGDLLGRGNTVLKNTFLFCVRYNVKLRDFNPNSDNNIQSMVKKNMVLLQFSSILIQNIENCYYIINYILMLISCLGASSYIPKINEKATVIFSISYQHGHIKKLFSPDNGTLHSLSKVVVLICCQYALFKSTCSKTSYLTLCDVPHEWFVFLHRALWADWVDNILPTSKCRYVFSTSKYSKINS